MLMNDTQIKYMVDQFLSWKLPDDFGPDAGIGFDSWAEWPWPIGTNLLDATQATAMVLHMVDGLPLAETAEPNPERVVCDEIIRIDDERLWQERSGFVGTPGGFEHMDDVWRKISKWASTLRPGVKTG
jgi:hypothetical protein